MPVPGEIAIVLDIRPDGHVVINYDEGRIIWPKGTILLAWRPGEPGHAVPALVAIWDHKPSGITDVILLREGDRSPNRGWIWPQEKLDVIAWVEKPKSPTLGGLRDRIQALAANPNVWKAVHKRRDEIEAKEMERLGIPNRSVEGN